MYITFNIANFELKKKIIINQFTECIVFEKFSLKY